MRFKHQKRCEYCNGHFTTTNGNKAYCDKCQKILNIPIWDKENKKSIPRQTSLIPEEKIEQKEVLWRGE